MLVRLLLMQMILLTYPIVLSKQIHSEQAMLVRLLSMQILYPLPKEQNYKLILMDKVMEGLLLSTQMILLIFRELHPLSDVSIPGGYSSGIIANTESELESEFIANTEQGVGQGGDIRITTPQLTLSDGGVITSRSRNDFAAGNITVNADTLEITGGAQIQASAFSTGSAGNINLNINNQITIDGSDPTFQERFNFLVTTFDEETANFTIDPVSAESGIFANTISGSQGDGGNINIGIFDGEGYLDTTKFTEEITLSNQGLIAADSQGTGSGGTINIQAEDINLDAGAIIATTTTKQEGANSSLSNINLSVDDNLILRNNSQISAEAKNSANGGNVTIGAEFIIGLPSVGSGSDIRANAGQGSGGIISIDSQGVLGFEDSKGLRDNFNDIDASSLVDGLDGVVAINNPDVDPTSGLVELPAQVTDPSDKVIAGCAAASGNSFTITGKGGLPENPNNTTIYGQTILADLRDFTTASDSKEDLPPMKKQGRQQPSRSIIQVNGWLVNQDGEVELVAVFPQETSFIKHPNCQDLSKK